jgi:hypothetical protein
MRDEVQNLRIWLAQEGVKMHESLSIEGEAGSMRMELKAGQEMLPHELLASIPLTCLLSPKTASSTFDDIEDLDMQLAACLMDEICLGSKSRWSPYLETLPKRVPLPCVWSDNALKWLKGSEMPDLVSKQKFRLQTGWERLVKRGLPSADYHQFVQCCTLVWSRAFIVDSTYHRLAMVPLADMCAPLRTLQPL